jgi:hypothetical protein
MNINKIKEHGTYKLKGYTIEGIIELAYSFGKADERWKPSVDQTKDSKAMCIKQLLDFVSFQELNN